MCVCINMNVCLICFGITRIEMQSNIFHEGVMPWSSRILLNLDTRHSSTDIVSSVCKNLSSILLFYSPAS